MWTYTMFVTLLAAVSSSAEPIIFKDGGYENIIVAVHDSVPEDEALLTKIQEMFTEGSRLLYNATDGRAHYRNVTISLPPSWTSRDNYINVSVGLFPEAHVRIDHPNPTYGDTPYTEQTGGCGEEGRYIHFTPNYLKSETASVTISAMYGLPGKQLIHEWAHLRYGVFDEYGDPNDPKFPTLYRENGELLGTTCMRGIKGTIYNKAGGPCLSVEGQIMEKNCIFVPHVEGATEESSLMYGHFIPSVYRFCDSSVKYKHNTVAPNKHNAMCNYRSTWDVIMDHKDFVNSRADSKPRNTDPTFRIVMPKSKISGRYVLTLDVSFSMKGRRIQFLHAASTRLVQDIVPDGASLGIVTFSTHAFTIAPLTKITGTSRQTLSALLPKDVNQNTAIGKGLQESLKVLREDGKPAEGAMIILITDGEENVSPNIDEVLPALLTAKVVVNTIAFGSTASKKLERLAFATGGKSFLFQDVADTSSLDSAFLESVTQFIDPELQSVQIVREEVTLTNKTLVRLLHVDEELGNNTVFTVTGNDIGFVEVSIVTPLLDVVDYRNRTYYEKDDRVKQQIRVRMPDWLTESGLYRVNITRLVPSPVTVTLAATSSLRSNTVQPISLYSWLSVSPTPYGKSYKVFSEVRKGYRALVNAKVTATVYRPTGGQVAIDLLDNGVGADVTKDDGVYSAYFTKFNGPGRYGVVSRVVNDGTAILKNAKRGSSAYPWNIKTPTRKRPSSENVISSELPADIWGGQDEKWEAVEPFERMDTAGTFIVEVDDHVTPDTIPPGRITDLAVESSGEDDVYGKLVTLRWTNSGADLSTGQASLLELRVSPQNEDLLHRFQEAYLYNDSSLLVNGSLTPLPAGKVQHITVQVPPEMFVQESLTHDIYFACRSIDEFQNTAEVSVIASAHFGYLNPTTQPPVALTGVQDIYAIVFGVIVGVVILFGIGLVITSIKRNSINYNRQQ